MRVYIQGAYSYQIYDRGIQKGTHTRQTAQTRSQRVTGSLLRVYSKTLFGLQQAIAQFATRERLTVEIFQYLCLCHIIIKVIIIYRMNLRDNTFGLNFGIVAR